MHRLKSIHKGFVTGVALSLLVATGLLVAVRSTSAQGDNVWTDSSSTTTATTAVSNTPTINPAPTAIATPSPVTAVPVHTNAYVGLGDSVAAGLGLPTWTTATPQDKSCGRSPYSYVFEVGRQLNRPHAPYACSGATTADLGKQLDQAFAQGIPAVMSITAGANDISWSDLLRSCYTSTCGTADQTKNFNDALVRVQTNLTATMGQIQSRSGGVPPKMVLTGYYNPISPVCAIALPGITTDEVNWMTAGVNALNQTIKNVAANPNYAGFTTFAAIDYNGHDLCSASPWIQGLSATAPIHPNAAGQQAIARSVIQAAR